MNSSVSSRPYAIFTAACAPEDDDDTASTKPKASGSASETVDACAKANLETHTPGTLTITTDKPAYPPWFEDDAPENGKGYEGAVAAAVAEAAERTGVARRTRPAT